MKKNEWLIKRIMRISFIAISTVLLCSNLLIAAHSKAQMMNRAVSVRFNHEKLEDALTEFSKQAQIPIAYDGVQLGIKSYTVNQKNFLNVPAQTILDFLLAKTDITYQLTEESILLVKRSPAIRITGKVTDETGESIPGANVTVKGSSIKTVTNMYGAYTLTVPDTGAVLVFTFIGCVSQEIPVKSQTTINVQLKPSINTLNEVVVTALGIKRETKALSFSQQSIDPTSMNEEKSPNLINSLSGKVAGLQVVPAGFNTGSARVIIRGNNSLTGNNQPLFVVDGMPIDNSAGDDGALDYGNNAADINPSDIESIEVLKGPNAAALYGSRAANGVILITTKKGTATFKVSVNSNLMFQKLTEFPAYQNAYGIGTSFYIDNTHPLPVASVNYRSWGSPMLGQPYVALNGQVKPYLPQPDNVKDFYSTAHLFTNSVAVEGGNSASIYRISYTNYAGTSVVERLNNNASNNIDLRLQSTFSKSITLDTKISYLRNTVDNRQYSNANGRNPTNLYSQMPRSTNLDELNPYKDSFTGKEIGTSRNFSNPYWVINENPNQDTKDRVIATISPVVKINTWLKFTARLGADAYWWKGYEFNNVGSVIASNPNGYLRTFNTNQANLNLDGLFTATQKFKKFSFTGILGASSFSSDYELRQELVSALLQPGLINLSNAATYPTVTQTIRQKRLNSAYGSVSLGYHNYAFLDVTGRNDWSSTLPQSNNSYFYPSVGGSLILSDIFKISGNVLSYAKVRASLAIVGNDSDPYQLNQTYSFNGIINGATVASLSNTMNNEDLKPEKTKSNEYGVDLSFFKNRVTINATHYSSATTNQIITAQLPTSSGYKQRIYNAGEIRNWGNELSINATPVKTSKFTWNTLINYSKNNSKVVSLIPGVDRFVLNSNSSYIYVDAQVGEPYGYLRGLGVARDAQGHMLIADGGGLLTPNNDAAFGTSAPKWLGSISNSFTYGPLTLNFMIDVKMGGVLYSGTYSKMLVNGVAEETLYGRDDYYLHSVIYGENASELSGGAKWDAYYANGTKNTQYISPQSYEYARPNYAEFVMFDASYVKLRELSLGYTIPVKALARTFIKTAKFSLVGRNLAILYRKTPLGIDPEATSTSGNGQGIENGALPPYALYGFNMNLTF